MNLSQTHEQEVAYLAIRYGQPKQVVVDLSGSPFDPLTNRDRIGEVCMVVRRPDGRIITAKKTFYPPGAYRLLTGGIRLDESIEQALLRETQEETNLDVVIRRFLAVIEYRYHLLGHAENDAQDTHQRSFYTFAFLLDEVGGVLSLQDEHEQIEGFHFVSPEELPALADALENIHSAYDSEIRGHWHHWGRFRAVVHRVVFDALA